MRPACETNIQVMKTAFLRTAILITILTTAVQGALAQREITREEYIATYAPLAIQQQKQYGIPASIKMAQGMLESRYGNSDLSRRSNNHFGIKCKSTWTGRTVSYDDDEKGECFRCYDSIEESYRDHSEFLRNGTRYASLFELDPTDYKGWAHGLKAAGYATAPHYATSLIKCIEDYELYLLDEGEYPAYVAGIKPVTFLNLDPIYTATQAVDVENYVVSVFTAGGHGIFLKDGSRYLVAREGESYASIAKMLGLTERRLRRFNGKSKSDTLSGGDMVIIENPKSRRKA